MGPDRARHGLGTTTREYAIGIAEVEQSARARRRCAEREPARPFAQAEVCVKEHGVRGGADELDTTQVDDEIGVAALDGPAYRVGEFCRVGLVVVAVHP